jgi:hypothetical protein
MSSSPAAFTVALAAAISLPACGGSKPTNAGSTTSAVAAAVRSAQAAPRKARAHDKSTTAAHRKSTAAAAGPSTTARLSPTSTQPGATTTSTPSQSTPAGSRSAGAASPTRHLLDDTETVHITSRQGAIIIQQGVVKGTSIGTGTIVMHDRLTAGGGVTSSFTVTSAGGSVRGIGRAALEVNGMTVHYHGTARLVSGTGRYSRVRASHLRVTGHGTLAGQTTLHVTGVEWY